MAEERVQRRLAAILAADVVGYSRLMGQDEVGTLERLKACRRDLMDPKIAEHRGRVVKLMGDGALVEFASVVDAVRCAIAIQRDIELRDREIPDAQRIAFRIGINLGDVMIEGDDIYGDGVNIATRLQELAGSGSIYVSGTVFEHIGGRVETAFEDCGEQRLKNIDRPLRVFRVRLDGERTAPAARPIVGAQLPDNPSIAILPFTNMSGDLEQEYFSDGITEDIITELSRFRGLFVIARNSSFVFKRTAIDVRSIGQKLGVRYVVEGSVRRAGSRIRVTAQLIDAAAGNHLWAERYDRDLADIFEVQDEVSRAIVTNIAPRLQSEDQYSAKRRAPDDMRAYDHYLRAKLLIDTPADLSDLERGREHCNRAIEIDPGYARAYSYKALSYTNGLAFMEEDDPEEWVKQALASAEQAVALDDLDNVSHWVLGVAALRAQQPDRARRHIRKALAINPNDADVLAEASYIEVALGDPEAGLRNIAMALERNPMNPPWYHWVMGAAMELLGRYENALAEYDQYGAPNPAILKLRAMALAGLGRMDEARAQVQALLAVRPGLTVATLRKSEACFPGNDARMERLRIARISSSRVTLCPDSTIEIEARQPLPAGPLRQGCLGHADQTEELGRGCPEIGCITYVLAIALANKLARIAWSVLARGRGFEPTCARSA
jgi:TolB-like protein